MAGCDEAQPSTVVDEAGGRLFMVALWNKAGHYIFEVSIHRAIHRAIDMG